MPKVHALPAALCGIAAACFIGAFATPFISSDFEPDIPDDLGMIFESCTKAEGFADKLGLGDAVTALTGQACRQVGEPLLMGQLDRMLGHPVEEPALTWGQCLATVEAPDARSGWKACVKQWIITKAGIPVGSKSLPQIIEGLFQAGEPLLGSLVLLFSVLFPLSKVAMGLWVSLTGVGSTGRNPAVDVLRWTSRWSMTDVFIVALVIVTLKAHNLNFHFEAQVGVYLFAAGAILSSIAVHLLEDSARHTERAGLDKARKKRGGGPLDDGF